MRTIRECKNVFNYDSLTKRLDYFITQASIPRNRKDNDLRHNFANEIKRFHIEAGTYTQKVESSIKSIEQGSNIIRMFHQPNNMIALNILSQIEIAEFVLNKINTNNSYVAVFLILDYDVAGDQRFRSPPIPSGPNFHLSYFKGVLPKQKRDNIACAVTSPSPKQVIKWLDLIFQSVNYCRSVGIFKKENVGSKTETIDKFEKVKESLVRYYENYQSITNANGQALSWICNELLDKGILFVPASRMLKYIHNEMISCFKELLNRKLEINECISELYANYNRLDSNRKVYIESDNLLWYICKHCFKRLRMTGIMQGNSELYGIYKCSFCNREYNINLMKYNEQNYNVGKIPGLIPGVLLCDLLEIVSYKFSLTIDYSGGIDHLIASKAIRRILGYPSGNSFVWYSNNILSDLISGSINMSKTTNQGVISNFNYQLNNGKFPFLFYWLIFRKYEDIVDRIIFSAKNQTAF